MDSQYASPLLVPTHGPAVALERVPLRGSRDASEYDESWLQHLLFAHPECLPVAEIDASFTPLVPICVELPTPVGYVDALYATPAGKLVLLEAKLWRNPEARRKVVGQILDYAKELGRWRYEDLQREVSRTLGLTGNVLFQQVAARHPAIDEARFVDEVSRSLRTGRFMLLIVGDGIREGVGGIAEFLRDHGSLHFTFGLVEAAVFHMPDGGKLLQPRVLARTSTVTRFVVEAGEGVSVCVFQSMPITRSRAR